VPSCDQTGRDSHVLSVVSCIRSEPSGPDRPDVAVAIERDESVRGEARGRRQPLLVARHGTHHGEEQAKRHEEDGGPGIAPNR
jgi:hypothetical protein